jgi:DNA polymerase-4
MAVPNDHGCVVLHVDMDAFYASVEMCERPELAGQPVVVAGGSGQVWERGVVLSASYPARAYGVRSAMPVAQARRLCPHAHFVPPRFPRYQQVSRAVLALLRQITPLVEPLSLDEAFLDVGGSLRRLGMSPAGIAEWIRGQVFDAHQLNCSVGVAPNMFLAKLASRLCKPDGLLVVPTGEVLEFLHPLPVSALWGVGRHTAAALRRLGCRTVADVAGTPLPVLRRVVGVACAQQLHELSHGRDPRRVRPDAPAKSVGAEQTFATDVGEPTALRRELLRLVEQCTAALRARGLRGRSVVVKIRYPDFTTITRSRSLASPTDCTREVYPVAAGLLDAHLPRGMAVRLLGVRVGQLSADAATRPLRFSGLAGGWDQAGWTELERVADAARARYGSAAVRPATLINQARGRQVGGGRGFPESGHHSR